MKKVLGLDAELVEGNRGEFSVWADGKRVAVKSGEDFPTEAEVLNAIRASSPTP